MNKHDKKEQIFIELVNLMFNIAGYEVCYYDVLEMEKDWFNNYTMTEEQNNEWRKEGEKLICKKLKYMAKDSARKEMCWVSLVYGLKIEEKQI